MEDTLRNGNPLHKLKVIGSRLLLDDFEIRGLCGYTLKHDAEGCQVPRVILEISIEEYNLKSKL